MRYSAKIQNKTITNKDLSNMEDEVMFFDPVLWICGLFHFSYWFSINSTSSITVDQQYIIVVGIKAEVGNSTWVYEGFYFRCRSN